MKKEYKQGDTLAMRLRKSDEDIIRWASNQSELGDAIRFLIEQEIQAHGWTDLANEIVSNRRLLPTAKEIEPVLLRLAQLKSVVSTFEAKEILAHYYQLTHEERERTVRSGTEPQWNNNIRWARLYLKQKGYLDSVDHGVWETTQEGQNVDVEAEYSTKVDLSPDEFMQHDK